MSKTVIKSKNDINEAILSAAGKAVADGIFDGSVALPAFNIETPADSKHGDYAVNAALVWAKALRIAETESSSVSGPHQTVLLPLSSVRP